MKKILALVLLGAMLVLSLASCGGSGDDQLKIGVILIGDENEGYTYAHIKGIEAAREATGLEKSQVIYKYTVGENDACYNAAADLVDEGCSIIFSNSYGHQPFMKQAAEEFTDVTFVSMTGDTAAKDGLANFHNAFTNVYEARYLSGVVAGLKLKEVIEANPDLAPKVGYVGAFPYAEVVSGYTAFFLGIQSIVPNATMEVQYTSSWFNKTAESEAATMLIARGCLIIGQHADSEGAPTAVETARTNGNTNVYSVGYNVDMLSVAPTGALTSATNDWSVYYTFAFQKAIDGKFDEIPTDWCHGFDQNAVGITALGSSCAEGAEEKVAEIEAQLKAGTLKVFDCSKFTVNGEHLTTYTTAYGMEGQECIKNEGGVYYFSESTLRSAPYFDIRIDGITELNVD